MLNKVLKHSAVYGLAPYVTKIASFFTLPIITQDLTPEDYGVAGLVSGYVGLLGILSTLGLPVILSNSFFKHRKNYKLIWRHIYGFLSIWNLFYGVVIGCVLFFLIRVVVSDQNVLPIVFLTVAPILMFGATKNVGILYYQLNKKPKSVVWRSIVFGTLAILINLYTISYLKIGYMGWFYSDFIVGLLFNLSYWFPLTISIKITPIFKLRVRSIIGYLKISMPVIPHQYATYMLRSSDKAVMGFLSVPTTNVGLYSLSSNFGNYFYSFTSAISTAANPFVLEHLNKKKFDSVKNTIFSLQAIIIWVTFTFALWSREILFVLVKNDELNKVYPLVIILVMAFNYRPMYIASTAVFFFNEKTKSLFKVSVVAGIANVVLNLILIPIYGFEAAVYTTFICYMYVGFSGFYLKEFKENINENFVPLVWLSAIISFTILAYLTVEFSGMYKLAITLLSTFVFALLMKHFYTFK